MLSQSNESSFQEYLVPHDLMQEKKLVNEKSVYTSFYLKNTKQEQVERKSDLLIEYLTDKTHQDYPKNNILIQ